MPSRFEIESPTRRMKAYQPPEEAFRHVDDDTPTVIAASPGAGVAAAVAMRPSIPPFATLPPAAELTPASGYRLRVTPEMVQAARDERARRWAKELEKRNMMIVASLWAFAALAAGTLAFIATSNAH